MHIQQIRLETDGGVFQSEKHLEEYSSLRSSWRKLEIHQQEKWQPEELS
jgi:hypothetical protein